MKKILLIIIFPLLFSANICFAAKNGGLENIYGYLVGAGAGAALLAIIWGGIKFILAGGDPGSITEAKAWLVSGFTGLILIAAAGTIYKGITGEAPSFGPIEGPGSPEKPKEEELPGIYVQVDNTSIGYTTSQPAFSLKEGSSIEIKNGPETDYKFALFSEFNYMGNIQESGSKTKFHVSSIAILNTKDAEEIGTVKFYQGTGHGGGIYIVEEEKIKNFRNGEKLNDKIIEYKGLDVPAGTTEKCRTLYVDKDFLGIGTDPWCLQSIKINGKYAVILKGTYIGKGRYELFFSPGPANLTVGHPIWNNVRPAWAKIIPFKTR